MKLWQNVPIHVMLQCSSRCADVLLSLSSIDLKVFISSYKWWCLSKPSTWVFELYIKEPPEVYLVALASLLSLCHAVPVLPVMAHGDSYHSSPLLYLPLPSGSQYIGPSVFYCFTNICTFCAVLLWRACFLHKWCLWKYMCLQVTAVWSQNGSCAHCRAVISSS